MGSVNRAYLRNLARLYADGRPGGADSFIPDSDSSTDGVSFDTLVNSCIAEWYDMLVSARGHEAFLTENTFTVAGGTKTYTLPADFYQLLSARLEWGPTDIEELVPVGQNNRTDLDMVTTFARWTPKAYRLRGTQATGMRTFELFPTPPTGTSSVTCRYRYIPICGLLTDDTTTFDDANNTSDYVALSAAIKYRTVAEKPIGHLQNLLAQCSARILALADQRNANYAEQIGQTYPERGAGFMQYLADRRWI
ncbi:MAG TPA: hypothetical protein VJN18_35850 [Polyangiaceae bacterium]|nr:hypothetical protein [Polyangiaceae bacterium]